MAADSLGLGGCCADWPPKRTELGHCLEGTQRAARPLGTTFGKEIGAEMATEAYTTAMRDCGDFDDPCPDSAEARPQQGKCDEDNAKGCCSAGRGQSLVPHRAVDDALLERTVQLFEARSGRSLSKEDARQIVENVSGFFGILAEWRKVD